MESRRDAALVVPHEGSDVAAVPPISEEVCGSFWDIVTPALIRPVAVERLDQTYCYSGWFESTRAVPPCVMKARELLAWNMRRVRVAQGLSQERLAIDAAVNRGYLGGLEQLTENPTLGRVVN